MTDVHYGLTVQQRRLREALGPLSACGQRGQALRTTHQLADVTCERCRTMVESAGVAVWEIQAEKIEAKYQQKARALRWQLARQIAVAALVVAVAVSAVLWVTAKLWPEVVP